MVDLDASNMAKQATTGQRASTGDGVTSEGRCRVKACDADLKPMCFWGTDMERETWVRDGRGCLHRRGSARRVRRWAAAFGRGPGGESGAGGWVGHTRRAVVGSDVLHTAHQQCK